MPVMVYAGGEWVATTLTAPQQRTYLGAHHSPTTDTAFEELEESTGVMGVRRTYSSNLPSTFSSTPATSNVGKRVSWHSVKADWAQMSNGTLDTAVTTFVNSVPSGHQLMLTFAHEPENDGGNAATWRSASNHFYDLVKDARPETLVGPVWMDYTFNPSSGRNIADWTPARMDFAGIDTYNPYLWPMVGTPTTWVNQPNAELVAFTDYCDGLGIPGAIGEVATGEDETGIGAQRKVDWINNLIAYADAHGYLAVCWFNEYKPGDTTTAMLLDSSTEAMAAWAAHVATHPNRTEA